MNKIEIIDKLEFEQLKQVFLQVVKLLHYSDIADNGGYITAISKGAMFSLKHAFILPGVRMSGVVDISTITEQIRDVIKSESANVYTIVSQHIISNGFKDSLNQEFGQIKIEYIDRDNLISLVDDNNDIFWRHNDLQLLAYEKKFRDLLKSESQLKRLHLASDKFEKLINIYVQPSLTTRIEDPATHTLHPKRVGIDDIISDKKCAIIEGISGSGKSTLLQKIGIKFLEDNDKKKNSKLVLPIFLTSTDLLDHNRNVNDAILSKAEDVKHYEKLYQLVEDYEVVVLLDSIDEFDEKEKKNIVRVLVNNYNNKQIKFYLATRSNSIDEEGLELRDNVSEYRLSKFNTEQIRRFVQSLLPDKDKVNTLMESLRENKIMEKMPITPLTLSLLTIIYDEHDYEVPATITDIYKQFNTIINGRATVSSKIGLIDANFRERILSVYALHLMEAPNHAPLEKTAFVEHFKNFYKGKSLTFKYEQLEDVLEYIIQNTGVLYLKENNRVCFAHDSYMEFYAAVEIFNNYRTTKEKLMVDNFFDLRWQNVAVFYAGMTKDMKEFAININEQLKKGNKFWEYLSGVQGAGYLSQALYMTDNQVRKELILTALNMVLETNEFFKKMTSINRTMLQNYKLPIVQLLSFLHFYEMFNSLTLREPLKLSFNELKEQYLQCIEDPKKYDSTKLPSIGFKLIELAFTMDSKRVKDPDDDSQSPLEFVIDQKALMQDVNLYALMDLSLQYMGKQHYAKLRSDVAKNAASIKPLLSLLRDESTGKHRFSPMDTILPDRRIKIFVEGKTDAVILEHAFITLTGGRAPYFQLTMATQNGETGSSTAVTSAVESSLNFADSFDYVIAIYDHDAAGLKEFGYLSRDYVELESRCMKKRKNANVFLLCMPIPAELIQYEQKKQEFNFFEIEHYFGHDFLKKHGMLKSQETLNNVYEIVDGKKNQFSIDICKETEPEVFKFFLDLFKKIDEITGVEVDYVL